MTRAWIVVKKELYRVFHDRKLVFNLFVLPALMIFVMYSLMGNLISNMESDIENHVPEVWVNYLPEGLKEAVTASGTSLQLVDLSKESNQEKEAGAKDAILQGTLDLYVEFPADFSQAISSYQKGSPIPNVQTYYNPSEDYSAAAHDKFSNEVLPIYRTTLLQERIADLDSLTVFTIDASDNSQIVDEAKAGGQVLAMMLPYLIVMLLFTGPMSLGVDAITGEKERGTMASMLVTPAKRGELVMGKLISLSILSCISAVIYAVSMVVAVPMLFGSSAGDALGFAVHFSPSQILELLAIMLTLVFLYVAVVSLLAVHAKTTKEAGSFLSPIYLVIIVAGVFTMFSGNGEPALYMYAIPVYGSALSIQHIMTGTLTLGGFLISFFATIAVSAIFTALVTRAFNSERVMFQA